MMKKLLFIGSSILSCIAVQAQQISEPVAGEASSITVRQIIVEGGPLMYPIVLLSFLAVCLIVFYLLTLRAGLIYPKKFLAEAEELAASSDIDGLKELCAADDSPAARIINAALAQYEGGMTPDPAMLREAMEEEGGAQAGMLWQRIQYLMDISVVAPMVGLLGTVWGMMVSFSGLEGGVNFANKAATLASGVSQAMFTTFGGLIVGILGMVFYSIFRGHVNKLVGQLETRCGIVVRKLTAKN